jgi:hypothetical protein
VFCFLPESPKFLVQKKEYERALRSYNIIAKVNGRKLLVPGKDKFFYQKKMDRLAIKRGTPLNVVEESDEDESDNEVQNVHRSIAAISNISREFTMQDLWADVIYRTNLIVIVLAWVASSFCFFIIGFYIKYIPGDIFSNMIACAVADCASSLAAGMIAQYYGTKNTLTFSFGLAAFGGVALMYSSLDPL